MLRELNVVEQRYRAVLGVGTGVTGTYPGHDMSMTRKNHSTQRAQRTTAGNRRSRLADC